MRITGDHCKFIISEFNTSIDWAVAILKEYEPDPYAEVLHMDAFDRRDRRIAELKDHVAYFLDGLMHAEYELHRDRFFLIASLKEEYDSIFTTKMPEWMWNPDVRSQNYEKFRGIPKHKDKDIVRSAIVVAQIRVAAQKVNLDLNSVRLPLTRGGNRPLDFPLISDWDRELVQRWRNADKAKSKKYRDENLKPAKAAEKAAHEATRDRTNESLRAEVAEQAAELVLVRAQEARWRELYEAVKTSDEIAKLKQQHTTEINNLTEKYEAMLAEVTPAIEEANAYAEAAKNKLNLVMKTHNFGRPVGWAAAVITQDMVEKPERSIEDIVDDDGSTPEPTRPSVSLHVRQLMQQRRIN